jgi:FlaA1/EpsC-like NDP-sugar epimerase
LAVGIRNRYVLLADVFLIAIAAWGAFTARFDWTFYQHRPEFPIYLAAALVIKPVVFVLLGMYSRYWRYTSIQDLTVVFTAVSASSAAMAVFVAAALGRGIDEFSRVVVVNDWLMTLATTSGWRVAIRVFAESRLAARTPDAAVPRRVLVVGAGHAGTMVAREMRRNPHLGMEPAGFLDDDAGKIGKHLGGLRVLGSTRALPDVVRAARIESVVIAMPTAPGRVVRAILTLCNEAGVKSQTIPGMFELLNGHVGIDRLRNLDIADLLRRSPVGGDTSTSEFVSGRVVLITGAGGSIGCELARQIARAAPSKLVLLGHGENSIFDAEASLRGTFPDLTVTTAIADIRDERRLALVFDRVKPAIVFHAAAHKHVPLMEQHPEEAVTNNIVGTRNVVNEALRAGVERFVLISTDKAVAPTSIMGASKRVAESIVRRAARVSGRAFVTVRFGNVLGSRGSVVNTFKRQIEEGGPVTVTDPEMTRFFMTIPEAVHLVLQASGEGTGGELFVLDMGEPVKIVDLARDLIKLSGLKEEDVPIVYTGVRAGEKMHEALYDAGMLTKPTSHPEVLEVVGPVDELAVDLNTLILELESAAHRGDRVAIDALLSQAVSGFVPAARPWDIPFIEAGPSSRP